VCFASDAPELDADPKTSDSDRLPLSRCSHDMGKGTGVSNADSWDPPLVDSWGATLKSRGVGP